MTSQIFILATLCKISWRGQDLCRENRQMQFYNLREQMRTETTKIGMRSRDKICINEMMKGNMKRQWRESMDLGINYIWKGFPDGSKVKYLPAMQDMQEMKVWSLDLEDSLEEEMATHSSVLAWKIPRSGEPDSIQSRVPKSRTWLSTHMDGNHWAAAGSGEYRPTTMGWYIFTQRDSRSGKHREVINYMRQAHVPGVDIYPWYRELGKP